MMALKIKVLTIRPFFKNLPLKNICKNDLLSNVSMIDSYFKVVNISIILVVNTLVCISNYINVV